MINDDIKKDLMKLAKKKFKGDVNVLGTTKTIEFTEINGYAYIWFNTSDNSTHVVKINVYDYYLESVRLRKTIYGKIIHLLKNLFRKKS